MTPLRPRLRDDVIARRHTGGDDVVVLVNHRTWKVSTILPLQWQVLRLADGTRTIEGVALAAGALGIETDPADLAEFMGHLDGLGLLEDGPVPYAPASDDDPDEDILDAPLDPIGGWSFRCTGRGVCCQVFPTILFAPLEANRAVTLMPDAAHEFYPERGAPREGAAVAPVIVEGRCRYLNDRLCELHALGGSAAKPSGCRAFPMRAVFDGERVRAAFAYECACVADGIGASDGEAPVPEGASTLGDMPRPTRVGRLAERVTVIGDETIERQELRALWRELADATPEDAAASVYWLQAELGAGSRAPSVARFVDAPAPSREEVARWVGRVAERLEGWRHAMAGFRHEDDLTRRAFGWMIDAATTLRERGLPPPPAAGTPGASREHMYLRTSFWIYQDATGKAPLVTALQLRALRLWLARVLRADPPDDPRAAEPLSLVEVMFRAHGLGIGALIEE